MFLFETCIRDSVHGVGHRWQICATPSRVEIYKCFRVCCMASTGFSVTAATKTGNSLGVFDNCLLYPNQSLSGAFKNISRTV